MPTKQATCTMILYPFYHNKKDEKKFKMGIVKKQKHRMEMIISYSLQTMGCFELVSVKHRRGYVDVTFEYDPDNEMFEDCSPKETLEMIYGPSAGDSWMGGDITVHPDPGFEKYEEYKAWGFEQWDKKERDRLCEVEIELVGSKF